MAMQEPAALPPQQFEIGRVLGTSFTVLFRNLGPFLAVALVVGIPYILVSGLSGNGTPGEPATVAALGTRLIVAVISLLTVMLTTSALTYGTVQDLRGQRPGFGDIFAHGLASVFKVLGAAVIYSVLVGLAFLLLVVPGVFVAVMWWVFVPVIVVENCPVGQSFSRSAQLTKGRRWPIFALALIGLIIQLAFGLVIGFIVGIVIALTGGSLAGLGWVTAIVQQLASCFSAVMVAVGYYYLRAEKEGIGIADIARVFD